MEKREFFERFYKENYKKFFYFSMRYLEDYEVCRDIVSSAFEYAWRELPMEKSPLWDKILLAFIFNKCMDEFRHQQVKDRFVQAKIRMQEQQSDEQLLEQTERVEMVKRYLEELPPKTRLILRECMVNNRKYKEVAEELELTDHAVKKHIIKGLKFLREKVKNSK